jgi:outer membrane protein assembly factor BamB
MRRGEQTGFGRRALAVLAGSTLGLTGTTASLAAGPTHSAAVACVRHAFAVEVGLNGKVLWKTALAATTTEYQTSFDPAVGASVSYWPEDGVVHALRNRDGKELWHYQQGLSLDGLWLNSGIVSVLTDDFGGGGVLSGVVAATGKVTWRVKIPGQGLTIDGPRATADGGLEWVRADGKLQVIDLVTGKARFSVREGTAAQIGQQFPQTAAWGGRIFYFAGGRLSAYDDKTGAVAWSIHGVPVHAGLAVAGGQVLLNGDWPGAPFAIGAIAPATGVKVWQFNPGAELALLASGSGRIAVGTDASKEPHEYVLDEHTGVVDWQTDTQIFGTPVVIRAHDTISVEGNGDYDRPALLVDRNLTDGTVIWQLTVHHQPATAQQLTVAGPVVVLDPDPEFAHPNNPLYAYSLANGHLAWTLASLRPLQATPVVLGKAILVSSADDADLC